MLRPLYLDDRLCSKVAAMPDDTSDPAGPDAPHQNPDNPDNPEKPDIPMLTVLRRGFARRCPACGKGAVLAGYLRRLPRCSVCGEDLSRISTDDGPAWATLIVVGHLMAPLMIILGRDDRIPVWVAILMLSAVMLVGVWLCLPRAKGLFIALIWRTDATGDAFSVPSADDETNR